VRLKRVGNEMKIIVEDGSHPEAPNPSLVRALVRAHVIRDRMLADKTLTLEEIAKSEGIVSSYATRLFRLTLLAPYRQRNPPRETVARPDGTQASEQHAIAA
jgi:site-specific DNA recombinase